MASADRVLYWGSGSAPCWKVQLMLEEKGLAYESKLLEFSKGEHKSEEVMALNPRGQLPTFKDGSIVVNDSLAALLYLEDAYPEPPLSPPKTDLAARAQCYQRVAEALFSYVKVAEAVRMKMRGAVNTEEEKKAFEEKVEEAKKELSLWEGYLSKTGGYAAGPSFTIADVMLAPVIMSAKRYGATLSAFPALSAYATQLEVRTSMQKTWPPHWKTSPNQTWLSEHF